MIEVDPDPVDDHLVERRAAQFPANAAQGGLAYDRRQVPRQSPQVGQFYPEIAAWNLRSSSP